MNAEPAPRLRFFGGKGGVGKTTCAAAFAVAAAERGQRVLALSTDPAHSLGDALGQTLSARPRRVAVKRGSLHAVELDAPAALERWLGARRQTLRVIAERGTYLDRDDVERFLHLSFPGVDELLALLELVRQARSGRYDELVVDTAPTGHTLRLLAMPRTLRTMAQVFDDMQEKHRVVAESLGGGLRARDAADALIDELEEDGKELEALLRDPARSSFHWVLLPEGLSVEETRSGLRALAAEQVPVAELIVNRLTPPPRGKCALCQGRRHTERAAVRALLGAFDALPIRYLPALPEEPRGLDALRTVAKALGDRDRGQRWVKPTGRTPPPRRGSSRGKAAAPPPFPLEVPEGLRLLFLGGKGGVGKSTCAAVTALRVAAASPKRRVLLLSTDPARRMGDVLGRVLDDSERKVPGAPSNLWVRELDADAAFARERARYQRSVDALFDGLRQGSRFDAAYDRAIVQDLIDLAPPGLDELFALFSVLDALFPPPGGSALGAYDLVVVDTAPTGHALRLLQMPAMAHAWVKALLAVLLKYQGMMSLGPLAEDLVALSRQLRGLQTVLADPAQARFVLVTRAAELPRRETVRLRAELRTLGLATPQVLVNALTPPGCGRCVKARAVERKELAALRRGLKGPLAWLCAPALSPPPLGVEALLRFSAAWMPCGAARG